MSKQLIECNVVVHFRRYEDELVFNESRAVTNLQELEDLLVDLGEDGCDVSYIEDKDMEEIVDKFIYVMRHGGYHFLYRGSIYYYYIDDKPYEYKGEAPSATEGKQITELGLRLAVQSHLQSLTGDLKEEELSYIEVKHKQITEYK